MNHFMEVGIFSTRLTLAVGHSPSVAFPFPLCSTCLSNSNCVYVLKQKALFYSGGFEMVSYL